MLILPAQPKILLPMPAWQWREPSLSQPRDQFGRQNRTRFKLELWRRDGGLIERHWYDDRDEFDFELWRVLQEPYADIVPMWAAVTTLTVANASNQTWDVPSDWNSADNQIVTIGGASSGDSKQTTSDGAVTSPGGAGGGCGFYNNLTLTAGASVTYRVGPGGASAVRTSTGTTPNRNNGTSTYFDGTTYSGASVGGEAGDTAPGSGKGSGNFTGGSPGNISSGGADTSAGSGGGGGAGPNGNGSNGATATPSIGGGASAGGSGDAGAGGAGGAAGVTGSAGTNVGGIGAGGGGGGASATGGHGGNYGAGGGGVARKASSGTIASGSGAGGAIIITYTPPASFLVMF